MSIFRVPIVLTWQGPGSPGVNVFSVRTETFTGDDAGNLQQAVDALHTFYTSIKDALASSVTVSLGEVVERTEQTRMSPSWTNLSSASTQYKAAPALQICIGWRTSLAARRGMGRTFIGPLAQDNGETDGTIVPSRLTLLGNAAQTLINDSQSGTNGWALGVYGLQDKAPKGTTDFGSLPHVHRDVIGYRIRDQFAVLRSRRD